MGPTHLRLIRPTKQTNRTIELLPNLKIFHFEPRHLSVHVDFLPIISNPSPFLFFSPHQRKRYSLLSTFTHFTAYPRSPSPLNLLLIPNFQTPPLIIPLSWPGSFYTSQFYRSPFLPFTFSLYKTQISISIPFLGLGFGFFFSL